MNGADLKSDGSTILAELQELRRQLGSRFLSESKVVSSGSAIEAYLAAPASRMLLVGGLALVVAMLVVAFSVLVFMVDRLHTRVAYAETHMLQMRRDLDEIYRLQTQLQQSFAAKTEAQLPDSAVQKQPGPVSANKGEGKGKGKGKGKAKAK